MRCAELLVRAAILAACLLFRNAGALSAQETASRASVDSTLTQSPDGGVSVEYSVAPFDFGPISHPAASQRRPLVFSEEEKLDFQERRRAERETENARRSAPRRSVSPDLSGYAVGEIPMREGITPSGARTYLIPVTAASQFKLTPSVAVGYNSQAGEGWAGYGWDIQGLSSIVLIGKNVYYHVIAEGADVNDTDAVFALDGVPLVRNTQSATMGAFPLITATGNILAAPNYNSRGYVMSFTVKYPDGTTADFGDGADAAYNRLSYPVKEMRDLEGNRITFTYSSGIHGGIDRLTAIRYGYTSADTYKGEMTFSYSFDSGYPVRYYAGRSVYRNCRLTGITSRCNGETLCQYTLSYEKKDNVWLLTQVDCESEGESLRPLVFEYGAGDDGDAADGSLYKDDSSRLILSSAFTSDDCDFIYRRGKFVTSSFNDGVLIYPYFDNYGVTAGHKPFLGSWRYQFGSMYPEDQVILFAPSMSDFNDVDASLTTGSGFQTMEAVEVDGDGLDELGKVNFNGISGSNTRLLISVYECGPAGAPVQSSQFEVQVQGTITSGDYVSPYRREYFWGDFRGNGKIQLLTVAFDKNYNDKQLHGQTSYAALIDLSSRTKLCEINLFDFPLSNYRSLVTCDLDNDSKTELCYATESGLDVYRLSGSSWFVKEKTLAGVTSSVLSSATRPYHITDLNGDGYIDIMVAPAAGSGSAWSRYAFDGASFLRSTVYLTSRTEDDTFMFMDVNRDGLSDLVKISGTALGTYMNVNGSSFGTFRQSPSTIADAKGVIPGNIVDRSGMSSFIKIDGFYVYEYRYSGLSPERRCLSRSVDGMGRMLVNSYTYLPSNSRYWTDNTLTVSNASGYVFRTLPIYVLDSEDAYLSERTYTGRYRSRYYSYFNGVVHNLGLGFCGFSKIRTFDYMAGNATEIVEEIRDTQKRGVVTSVTSRHGSVSAEPYHSVSNTYDNNSTAYGKLNPRLTESVESDALTGIVTTTSYSYGSYDLPSWILTSRRVGSGTAQTEKVTRTYENSVSASKYVLGVVTEESVVKEGNGDTDLSWKERLVSTYDSCCRPLTRKHYVGRYGYVFNVVDDRPVISPGTGRPEPVDTLIGLPFEPADDFERYDATNLVSETRWRYDTNGNVVSEEHAGYGAAEFVGVSYAYDSDGLYLLTETDALGRTTAYGGHDKFGNPATVTDCRNRVTTYTYDAWGDPISVTRPDGTVERTAAAWGGAGLYTVTKTVTGRPETIIHYDALGREIRSGVKRFDAQWQWTATEYDNKGRLYRTSLPYRGDAASCWNTYIYDDYNRPVSLTEASGKTTAWSYGGTSVTTVKDGISSTSTTDACGNVISVTDAGGTITYALRDDGQPSAVTAPGNVTTTFIYDDYGRRTWMVDPSAGTQIYDYVQNGDGSSVITHTNPNGKVKTRRDKHGRITLVERPGEYDTAYTYDAYGLLVAEQSTNGTGKEYTYDGLDRVATVKETIPDGKWLRRTYSYGTDGVLNSIQYASQSGQITTESYSYSNGHNTGVTLPDGTAVWRLVSENDLGMATSITSGGITREYGFTAFGMPAYRRMDGGDLQDFTYNFDVATGNLLSRADGVNGQTETFSYDGLNRLVAIGSRQICYDSRGNILSMDGIGSMTYGNTARPYQITMLTPEGDGLVPDRQQSVSYTCYNRPSILTEGGRSAAFTYNGDGDRVKMYVADGAAQVLSRYYIGGRYEYDQTINGSEERLYLGGDAYSAPMVYRRENGGNWTAYNIGRDYLGNVTQIATLDGTPVAEYSYDPWGRLRDPETLEIYTAGNEPELFLGRGFTGHEHLAWFGLVNMNARLYDPLLGRFLSPDPYVQAPDFSQNFNRYSYALNNPLRYTDETGEFVISTAMIVSVGISAAIGGISGWLIGRAKGATGIDMAGYIAGGFAIGGLSSLAGASISAIGGSAWLAGAVGGAVGGCGFSGLSTNWDAKSMLNGTWRGTLSGFIGGGIGSAIGGGWGAFAAGFASSGVNSALNGGDVRQIGLSSLLGGVLSYGSYELVSYIAYSKANLEINSTKISYRQFKTMQADYQRSRFWRKEYGGILTKNGGVVRTSKRYSFMVPFSRGNIIDASNDGGVLATYHTHWARPNVTYSVNAQMNIDINGVPALTSNGPSEQDVSGIAGYFGGDHLLIDYRNLYVYNSNSIYNEIAPYNCFLWRFFPTYLFYVL